MTRTHDPHCKLIHGYKWIVWMLLFNISCLSSCNCSVIWLLWFLFWKPIRFKLLSDRLIKPTVNQRSLIQKVIYDSNYSNQLLSSETVGIYTGQRKKRSAIYPEFWIKYIRHGWRGEIFRLHIDRSRSHFLTGDHRSARWGEKSFCWGPSTWLQAWGC